VNRRFFYVVLVEFEGSGPVVQSRHLDRLLTLALPAVPVVQLPPFHPSLQSPLYPPLDLECLGVPVHLLHP
jgi:hypothetical protein